MDAIKQLIELARRLALEEYRRYSQAGDWNRAMEYGQVLTGCEQALGLLTNMYHEDTTRDGN